MSTERLDIALERIAAEREARSGRLDLGNLGLTRLPDELFELEWLEALVLGGWFNTGDSTFRKGPDGWTRTDEPYHPIQVTAGVAALARLPKLRSLDLSGARLRELSGFAGLEGLQQLDCSRTEVADLSPLAGLRELQQLDCSRTQVADLSPLAGLSALQQLDCSETQVADLNPLADLTAVQQFDCSVTTVADLSPLTALSALQQLNCWDTQVADLSPLAGLSALQQLNCWGTQVADLSPLAGLSALQQLDCSATQVGDLSPLTDLSALRQLACWNTQVGDLSPLAGLRALQQLHCSETPMTDLSPLAGLTALQLLDCSETPMADLRPLAGLSALKQLICWNTQVGDLSPLAGLSALQRLHCSETQVTDLGPLAGLSALQQLDCSATQVADLSPVTNLSALQRLNCYKSPICFIPDALLQLPELKFLLVSHHPDMASLPGEVLSQTNYDNCLPRLRAHLADLKAGAEPLRDLKVIVLGNGRVGKTQLCRRLRGEPFEADADSTHGITVTAVEFLVGGDEPPARLNLWDFGGQDLYHGTHALFMRTRALFVVVWSPETEDGEHEHAGLRFQNHPLAYWLEYVRHLGGAGSPLLLVQTRCDEGRGERPRLPVADRFIEPFEADGRLVKRVAYSARDESGREALAEALRAAVQELRRRQGQPLIGRNRLAVWNRLEAWRDADARRAPGQREHRLVPYPEFEALCREQAIHDPPSFAEVLHNAGMVYYRPGCFDDCMLLEQSWALEAVYALFNREDGVYAALARKRGHFTRDDLDLLLWRRLGLAERDQAALLEMMVSSGVCFVHRHGSRSEGTKTEYVAPDLLPDLSGAVAEELAARWELVPGEPHQATFTFPFLSPAIARTLLSRLGGEAQDSALYWRYGMSFYERRHQAVARVEELPDAEGYGGRIRLVTRGHGAARLLETLVERVAELDSELQWGGRADTDRPPRRDDPKPPPLEAAPAPPRAPQEPEVYISYAWREERESPLVEELGASLREHGIHLRRDTEEMQPGDRISHFMERLSAGRCVVVVVSDAYLRSENCMTELYRLWVNARQQDTEFLARIVPLVQPGVDIGSIEGRVGCAAHWQQRHAKLTALVAEHGPGVLGSEDFTRYKLIGGFHTQISDILAYVNDKLVPRDRPTLAPHNVEMIAELIRRALREEDEAP